MAEWLRGGSARGRAWARAGRIAAALVLWGAGPVAAEEGALEPSPPAVLSGRGYTLGAGDVVMVRVYGEDRLTGQYSVDADGALDLPWIGRVPVAGRSLVDTAAAIGARLRDGYINEPQVVVEVKTFGSRPVQVLGAVSRPGTYYLMGETDLLAIVAMAGGVKADQKAGTLEVQVKRERDGAVQLSSASLDRLMGAGVGNQLVQAGDVVVVTKGRVFFVSGQVSRPGELPWREGLTVTQALAAAGGPSSTARLRRAWLLRGDQRIPINIRAVLRGKEPDRQIQAEDQLVIDESPI